MINLSFDYFNDESYYFINLTYKYFTIKHLKYKKIIIY